MIFVYLFTMFFRIGLFGFGGGLAMLPLIFQSVQSFGIMTAEEFSNLVALSQVTPGPMAVNAATYVGFNYAGLPGAMVATLGVCLPAFILMMIVYHFVKKFNDSRIVQGVLGGIRPVTVALIGAAVIFVSETVLAAGPLISKKLLETGFDYFNLIPICIFAVTVIFVGKFKMKPIRVMILMGIAGALLCS
ncbi:MAG: chromate transporter [Firmicutes bacterium]|nr:chromate transporter [Bacillota bacterium]MBR3787394.1 chromate transporter [Bacillota bacterium]